MNTEGVSAWRQERLGAISRSVARIALAVSGLTIWTSPAAFGQSCWIYVDGGFDGTTMAETPIECVEIDSITTDCAWNSSCHDDGDIGDCCTTLLAASPQTVREFHERWHACFGSIGASDGDNPPLRGQRWYAFHRQMEVDFNLWRDDVGLAHIESIEWCPDITLPHGHFGGRTECTNDGDCPSDWSCFGGLCFQDCTTDADCDPSVVDTCDSGRCRHPEGCGEGPNRPGGLACDDCDAFPQCLYYLGAGPIGCPSAPSTTCGTGSVSYPYTALEQFPNVEEIANMLDAYFHGQMHGAVGTADGGVYVDDINGSTCSTRDPMFWRLHKALDDVVRAWQDAQAVDIVIVLDESGSMSGTDAGGIKTKLETAKEAAGYFADFMDDDRTAPGTNRLGVVSYSTSATSRMSLTSADGTTPFVTDNGADDTAFESALATISAGGCTAMGDGIQTALEMLCPPGGDCGNYTPPAGENTRKAILLLTDGLENEPPCLLSAGASGSGCGSECFGATLDYDNLGFTQVCAIGFGNSYSLNGDLLTLLAERQGGVYLHNADAALEDDLKKFFITAYGQLTNEFLFADPSGVLAENDPASEPVEYTVCSDTVVSFASGWNNEIPADDLRLMVTSPNGDLVRSGEPGIQSSNTRLWDFSRIRLPHNGESTGTWRSQLIRPHRIIVNGFTPDSFADVDTGVALVRSEIQRVCPDGCENVLYFEQGQLGPESAYAIALKAEQEAGLVNSVKQAAGADDFTLLLAESWDLIVYSYSGLDEDQPYDSLFSQLLCRGQRAILTEVRPSANFDILECAGVQQDQTTNWKEMSGDGRLVDGPIAFVNPGHDTMTYGVTAVGGTTSVQATANAGRTGAIVVNSERGDEQHWFISVLGSGLSKLDPHMETTFWRTGDDLVATVRVLPSYVPAGGYDSVDARVEVTYPLTSAGSLLAELKLDPGQDGQDIEGERLDARVTRLANTAIPTGTRTFKLYDDGTHGDQIARNAYWSGVLTGLGRVEGVYQYRFILDFTIDGCATHRELTRAVYLDIDVDQSCSTVDVGKDSVMPDGRRHTPVTITPTDFFGNLWGPGRAPFVSCGPKGECDLAEDGVVDNGDGSYGVSIVTPPGVGSVRLHAFDTVFDVKIQCADCPALDALSLAHTRVVANEASEGEVRLDGPAPTAGVGGALVYVSSSNSIVAEVPESISVPASATSVKFPITTRPHHDFYESDGPTSLDVEITVTYGGEILKSTLTVTAQPTVVPPNGPRPPPPSCTCGLGAVGMMPFVSLCLFWMRRSRSSP